MAAIFSGDAPGGLLPEASAREAPVKAKNGTSTLCVAPELVTFEDVAVPFSAEEWSLLEGWQKQLHQDVMLQNYTLLLSLGNSLPSAEVSSLIHQLEETTVGQNFSQAGGEEGAHGGDHKILEDIEGPWDTAEMSDREEEGLTPTAGEGDAAECRSSLHLCALMKLVKDIPEFLYGRTKAPLDPVADSKGEDAEEDPEVLPGDAKTAGRTGSWHLLGFPGDLADVSFSPSSDPETPASSTEDKGGDSPIPGSGGPMNTEEHHLAPGPKKQEMEGLSNEPCGSRVPQGSSPANQEGEPCARSPAVEAEAVLGRPSTPSCSTKIREHPEGSRSLCTGHQDPASHSPDDSSTTGAVEETRARGEPAPRAEASPGPGHPSGADSTKVREADSPRPLRPSRRGSLQDSPAREEQPAPESTDRKENPKEKAAEEKPLQGLLKGLKELIVHQPRPPPQAPRRSSTGGWPETQACRRRRGGSGSLPIRVKIEATEEERCKDSPGHLGKKGADSPRILAGETSAVQTAGDRTMTVAPPTKDRSLSAAVKIEWMTHSPQPEHLDGPRNAIGCPGAGNEQSLVDETAILGVKIKMEPGAEEEELAFRGLKESPEEDEEEEEGPLQSSLPHKGSSRTQAESRTELGLWVPYSEEWSPATSPLHGLLNCLKDIPTPRQPWASTALPERRGGGGGEKRKGGRRGRPELSDEWAVPEKMCPLSSRDQTPPALSTWASPAMEDIPSQGAQEGPAGPANGGQGRDTEWRKSGTGITREGLSTPLESLERCLKDLPLNAPSQPCSPTVSLYLGSSPERLLRWTPERGRWTRKGEEAPRKLLQGMLKVGTEKGLERCLKELPLGSPRQTPSPLVSSSFGSSPDGRHRWTPEAGRWAKKERGYLEVQQAKMWGDDGAAVSGRSLPPAGSSIQRPLHFWGMRWRRRLCQHPFARAGAVPPGSPSELPQPAVIPSRQRLFQRLPRRRPAVAARGREVGQDGGSTRKPYHSDYSFHEPATASRGWLGSLGTAIPKVIFQTTPLILVLISLHEEVFSVLLGSPAASPLQHLPSGSIHTEAGTESSPLHRLMNCLKDIPIRRPSYLHTPSLSSSSSSCSETERERESPGRSRSCSDCGQDTCQGSEMEEVVGPKEAESWRRRRKRKRRPSEQEGDLAVQEPRLVEVGPCVLPASPLHQLESCLKDRASSRPLPSHLPPASANAHPDRMPQGGNAGSAAKVACSPSRSPEDTPTAAAAAPAAAATPAMLCALSHCDASALGPLGRTSGLGAGWGRPEGRVQRSLPEGDTAAELHSQAGAAQKVATSHRHLQSLANSPGETPAHPLKLVAGNALDNSAPREGDSERGTSSVEGEGRDKRSPLQGLIRCLKEIATRGPSPVRQSASRSPGELRGKPAKEEEEEAATRRAPQEAQDNDDTALGTQSCGTEPQGEGEPGSASKQKSPSPDLPLPYRRRCGSGTSPESKAEVGGLGPLLSRKLDRLSADMGAICRDVAQLQSHLDRLEQDARGWGLELATLRMENRSLSEYVRRMEGRCRALESRSRRNNLRMLGLPEGAEGSDPLSSFLQRTLPEMLGLPLESRPPEAAILQAAHGRPLSYAGVQVTILPDFCSSLSRRRQVPFGAARRSRWLADPCFSPRHASFYPPWPQGRRGPLAASGPLAGEREGPAVEEGQRALLVLTMERGCGHRENTQAACHAADGPSGAF
nr:protein KRBA1 [Pogona vitticeps]